ETERWSPDESYEYQVGTSLAAGEYLVRLHLAEIFNGIGGAGQRVFDILLEGQLFPALDDIDLFGTYGAGAAVVIDQVVTVTDGTLNITVADGPIENSKLNGFAVFAASLGGGGGNPAATVSVTPNSGIGASTFGNNSFLITNN